MKKLLVALVVGALLALPMSAVAMDALTQNQLGNVDGQAGLSIGFGSSVVTEISFNALSWGDPDGYSTADSAGWLIIDGTIGITLTVGQGEILEVDIAYTSGATTFNSVTIPAGRTFLALSLPSTDINVTVPETLNIGFGTQAANMDCTLGMLNLSGLNVSVGAIDSLYVWCHD